MVHLPSSISWQSVDGLIRESIQNNIRATNLSFQTYVFRVIEHHRATVPECQQSFTIYDAGDAFDTMRQFSKKLKQCIDIEGRMHLPAVLVPSLIAALDEPFQSDCRTAVVNLISPERLQATAMDGHPLDRVSVLMREQSEALEAYLHVARDGFDNDTPAELQHAFVQLQQLRDAAEQTMGIISAELKKHEGVLKVVR